ncbi:MAG: protein kinase [Cyanobacteria bacterium REEB67]|nr:protein kinase [Cyanobacteria bacterium REEB67]
MDKVLAREGSLDVNRAVDICQQICEALEHAHHKGIVDRDLKPSNIVLCDRDSGAIETRDLVRIVDFGIAKVLAGPESRKTFDLTHTGDLFGSTSYMSPDNPVQTIVKHLSDPPAPLKQTAQGQPITPSLEAIIMHCLAKAPDDRYGSMQQLRQDLSNDTLSEKTTFAKPPRHKRQPLPLALKIAMVALVNFAAVSVALTQDRAAVQSATNAQNIIASCEQVKQDVDLISECRNTGTDAFGVQFSRQWEIVTRDNEHLATLLPNGSPHQRQRGLAGGSLRQCQNALVKAKI